MSRKTAILRMAKIMIAGLLVPIIIMPVIYTCYPSLTLYTVIGVYLYLYIFGSYIKRLHRKINEQYPEDDNTNEA